LAVWLLLAWLSPLGHAQEVGGTVGAPGASPSFSPERPVPPAHCLPVFAENRLRWRARLPEPLETLRSLYLLGECHMANGEHALAERFFQQGLNVEPAVRPHLGFKLMQNAMAGGGTYEALHWLRMVLASDPQTGLGESVREVLQGRLGLPDGAEADYHFLSTYFAMTRPEREDHDLIARLRELAIQFGDEPARRQAELLLWKFPKDEASAAQSASDLAALGGVRVAPSGEDYERRSKTLYRLRLFSRLIGELEARDLPRWEPEAARRMGRRYFASLLRERDYGKAATQIAKAGVKRRFAFTPQQALGLAVRVNIRRRHLGTAQRLLKRLEALAPDDENLPGYYLELARQLQTKKQIPAMLAWCRRILEKYPKQPEAAMAYWLPIWSYYERGNFPQAARWSEQAMANTGAFSAETRARFYYWHGRALLAQGRAEAARKPWDELQRLWPTTFYGLMLRNLDMDAPETSRFRLTAGDVPGERSFPEVKAVWEVEPLRTALFLFVIGEDERAAAMMGGELGKPLANGLLEELGEVFSYFDRFRLQYRITSNYFYSDLKRRPVSDTPIWRYAYPRAFWEQVVEQTGHHEVNPYFVLAVMREESNFHAAADSRSGAKGLMQLMPATARMLAKRHRMPYDEAALTRPDFNIALGTLYLKRVLKRYRWNPILAAASYNAGPNAVKRWMRKYKGRPADEFVESIPYDETRAYVKRVISSYLIYKELYDGAPGPG
jgi:soluble lytic murein transglycosylase